MTDLIQLRGGYTTCDPRLDRLPHFDQRSRAYPIRPLTAGKRERSYTWRVNAHLDQGTEGACTGFAVAHDLAARPVPIKNITEHIARGLYHRARQIDEWPGENYEGSSVLAAVKAAAELGAFTEYRWAFSEQDLALAVGYTGPAILGVPWFASMYHPDADGFLRPAGGIIGGHAILCHSIDVKRDFYRVHNSWGPEWGENGTAKITRDDMRTLLNQQGEACIPVIRRKVQP